MVASNSGWALTRSGRAKASSHRSSTSSATGPTSHDHATDDPCAAACASGLSMRPGTGAGRRHGGPGALVEPRSADHLRQAYADLRRRCYSRSATA